MSPGAPRHIIRFASFELDVSAGELRNRGLRLPLQGQPIQVLTLLLEKAGHVVTREELRNRIWPADTFVDFDHALNKSIASLREVLADSAARPRYIETLRRRGYRWVGPVDGPGPTQMPAHGRQFLVRLKPDATSIADLLSRKPVLAVTALVLIACAALAGVLARAGRDTTASPQIRSLAVLPLEDLSGGASQEYFADGLTDELITNLAKLNSVRVISRTSVMRYKKTRKPVQQIGRELSVDAVVEGAIVRSPEKVRISVRLVHVPGDRHVWAESYERTADDIVLLQNEVARAIAEQIRGRLTAQEQSRFAAVGRVDPAAYEAYLEGRFFWEKRQEDQVRKAVDRFQRAIAKDPAYPRAYAGLADAYIVLGSWALDALPPAEAFPKAQAAAQKALELDSLSAEAHTALAAIKHIYEWDWEGAGIEFRRAIDLNPSYVTARQWYGQYLTELGRYEDGIAETAKAHTLDPVYLIAGASLAGRYYWARRYDEAIVPLQKTLDLDPDAPNVHRLLGQIYEQKRMFTEAITHFERAVALANNKVSSVAALGHGYGVAGRRREALGSLARLKAMSKEQYVASYHIALVHAGLGEKDEAQEWLVRAYHERSSWMVHLKVDPRLDPLRADARFQSLMARVGFKP